jgi:hypothetical protein
VRVTNSEIQAWLEPTKLILSAPNQEMLAHLEEEVLVRLTSVYAVTPWVDHLTTPKIVRTIISKKYASWHIDKVYSENQEGGSDYAARLDANAESVLIGLIDGVTEIPGVAPTNPSSPSFYPTDASSAQEPTADDPSLGPARFSLGKVF